GERGEVGVVNARDRPVQLPRDPETRRADSLGRGDVDDVRRDILERAAKLLAATFKRIVSPDGLEPAGNRERQRGNLANAGVVLEMVAAREDMQVVALCPRPRIQAREEPSHSVLDFRAERTGNLGNPWGHAVAAAGRECGVL